MEDLIAQSEKLGFTAIGFSHARRPEFFDFLSSWVKEGRAGEMKWMERHLAIRENPCLLLEGCRTVISLAYPYPGEIPATADGFRVSRYAEPLERDYHDRVRERAHNLASMLRDRYPGEKTRACVDSAPIMERSFAYSSGIGFIGRNNMLIIPGEGSFLFLAEVLFTGELPFAEKTLMKNQCGSCTRCMDACPTGALSAPFSIDASKCLSYLTIEHSGGIPEKSAEVMGDCFFGCDICQEVCPFNSGMKKRRNVLPTTCELMGMEEAEFRRRFGKSALARAGLEKIKANITSMKGAAPSLSR